MAKLQIDGDDIITALQTGVYDRIQYYLNTETGKTIIVYDGMIDGEDVDEDEDIEQIIEDGPYFHIAPVSSNEAYRVMEDFACELPEGKIKDKLLDSLNMGKGVFRRFKDRLHEHPKIQEQYFRYEELAYRKFAEEWLELHGIDAELTFRELPPLKYGG